MSEAGSSHLFEGATAVGEEGFEQCLCWGTFLPERGANGAMSLHYCAADCCLKIEASPTGHECTSVWA